MLRLDHYHMTLDIFEGNIYADRKMQMIVNQ